MTKMTFIICNAQMNIKNKERNLPPSARSALLAANGSFAKTTWNALGQGVTSKASSIS
jgi:hypothetical protein